MTFKPATKEQCQDALDANTTHPTQTEAAESLGITRGALQARLRRARFLKLKPSPSVKKIERNLYESRTSSREDAQAALDCLTLNGGKVGNTAKELGIGIGSLRVRVEAAKRMGLTPTLRVRQDQFDFDKVKQAVLGVLRQSSHTVSQLAMRFHITEGVAHELCKALHADGHNVFRTSNNVYSIEKTPKPTTVEDSAHEYASDDKGVYRFGVVSDTHLGSKYYRADVLNELYQWFAKEGITRVYHAGNWIDGEARFNKHDLVVHGMDAQCRYLAEHYPRVPGITTYAVAGDDHEGWYGQREGVDIGRYAERIMRDAGREDWVNLGYMESFIKLKRTGTKKFAQMLVMHPGGGSAYAISYTSQKIVESLAGGERPAVLIVGHYHKMELLNIRNTWVLQAGCTKDQDPFLRKKRIEVHIGGTILELHQNEDGAVTDCKTWMRRFFTTGYYNDRFSHSGAVVLPSMSR